MKLLKRVVVCLGLAFLPFSATAEETRKFGNEEMDVIAIRYRNNDQAIHAFDFIVREPIDDAKAFEMIRAGGCGFWLEIKLTGGSDQVLNTHRLPCNLPKDLKKGEIITCAGTNHVDAGRAVYIWENTVHVVTDFKGQCLEGAKL